MHKTTLRSCMMLPYGHAQPRTQNRSSMGLWVFFASLLWVCSDVSCLMTSSIARRTAFLYFLRPLPSFHFSSPPVSSGCSNIVEVTRVHWTVSTLLVILSFLLFCIFRVASQSLTHSFITHLASHIPSSPSLRVSFPTIWTSTSNGSIWGGSPHEHTNPLLVAEQSHSCYRILTLTTSPARHGAWRGARDNAAMHSLRARFRSFHATLFVRGVICVLFFYICALF
ncbi:hypothetical protein JB92DRAFT_778475 [Gautieria morchelliformis]|nr:hypothetical protein JB92DRAFT_778475 [Gautieria morchelliformis]